jgi:hypothetical protein
MSLNGWVRIGIVLSILWMVGGTFWFWQQQANQRMLFAKALGETRSNCIGTNGAHRMQGQPELTCPTQQEVDQAWTAELPFWWLTVIPLAVLVLAWVQIGIGYGVVRWRGFRPA